MYVCKRFSCHIWFCTCMHTCCVHIYCAINRICDKNSGRLIIVQQPYQMIRVALLAFHSACAILIKAQLGTIWVVGTLLHASHIEYPCVYSCTIFSSSSSSSNSNDGNYSCICVQYYDRRNPVAVRLSLLSVVLIMVTGLICSFYYFHQWKFCTFHFPCVCSVPVEYAPYCIDIPFFFSLAMAMFLNVFKSFKFYFTTKPCNWTVLHRVCCLV